MNKTQIQYGERQVPIAQGFANGKAFIPFITAGDPDLETTANVVRSAVNAGATLIEFGIPFSDPMAEGPVIQAASERSLKAGTTTDKIFDMVSGLRDELDVPFAFMTYANLVFSYGIKKFGRRCRDAGVSGLILPDVPFEEKTEFESPLLEFGVELIPLIAPSSEDRIATIAQSARGFVYLVSSLGVTGERSEITTDLASIVDIIRKNTHVPVAVGFGISAPEQASTMASISDGAIVGSAIVRLIHESGAEKAPQAVKEYVASMTRDLQTLE